MLALYHATLKEMSYVYEGNDVLRDMAVVPWIAFIDGCLMEKQMFISEVRRFDGSHILQSTNFDLPSTKRLTQPTWTGSHRICEDCTNPVITPHSYRPQ